MCRKRAADGPTSRIAPAEESAISRTIRCAGQGKGAPLFLPLDGTEFRSCEEAKEFYNLYSWEIGFGVRYGRSRVNCNG